MKFTDIPYARLDGAELKDKIRKLTEELAEAKCYADAKSVFLRKEELYRCLQTQSTLAMIRHDIDTRDPFYDEEVAYWDALLYSGEAVPQQLRGTNLGCPGVECRHEYADSPRCRALYG